MNILVHPDPALKQKAARIDPTVDHTLPELIKQMAELMYAAPGIGLAAPQIGVQKRVVVYDLDEGLHVLCNPRLTHMSDDTSVEEEGCLSVPGIVVEVERSNSVVCEAQDEHGNEVRLDVEGLGARMLQHEIDHLDGILILDRAAPDERKAAIRRYNEARNQL